MKCVKCKAVKSRIVNTRNLANYHFRYRRRECCKCGFRWTTYEVTRKVFDSLIAPYLKLIPIKRRDDV